MKHTRSSSEALESFECLRKNIFTLYKVAQQGCERSDQKWQDDRSMLEEYVKGLKQTIEILKAECKTVLKELEKESKAQDTPELDFDHCVAIEGARNEISRLQDRIAYIDEEEAEVRMEMNSGVKSIEVDIWETKLAVLQDTRRMCADEIQNIERNISRMEKLHTRKNVRDKGHEQLLFLRDHLARSDAKLESAKRALYFPATKEYLFRAGSAGVYLGAKDLHISDMTGSFLLSARGEQAQSNNSKVGKLHIKIAGACALPDETNGPSVAMRTPSLISKLSTAVSDSLPNISKSSNAKEQVESTSSKQPAELSMLQSDGHHDAQNEADSKNAMTEQVLADEYQSNQADLDWIPSHPRLGDGSSRAKRVAVKLLSKVALKDKPAKKLVRSQQTIVQGEKIENRTTLMGRFLKGKGKNAGDTARTRAQHLQKLKSMSNNQVTPQLEGKNSDLCTEPSGEFNESDQVDFNGFRIEPAASVEETASQSPQGSKYSTDGIESTQSSISMLQGNAPKSGMGLARTSTSSLAYSEVAPLDFDSSIDTDSSRQGVFLKLKAENMQLVGEKGSRVPNLVAKELILEVECALSVDVEYSTKNGWEFESGLSLEIISLKKKVTGNSLPLPSGLVKTILNLILPKIVQRLLETNLPIEFGEYLLESGSNGVVRGDIAVIGPSLDTIQTDLIGKHRQQSSSKNQNDEKMEAPMIVREARSLLGIGGTEAGLLADVFDGNEDSRLSETQSKCSIGSLCNFRRRFSGTETWDHLCSLWDRALQCLAEHKGLASSLNFTALMNGVIRDLAAKPLRVRFMVTKMNSKLNINSMLNCFRDYVERSAIELDKLPAGSPARSEVPLHLQLEALEMWHRGWSAQLASFKSKFKTAACAAVATANAHSLDIGLDRLHYEGPLSVRVPLRSQEEGFLSLDVSVPLGTTNSKLGAIVSGWKQAKEGLEDAAKFNRDLSLDGNLMIGRILAHRLSVGLCVNEAELARMLLGNTDLNSSTPCISPIGLQQMLGSIGELMSFNIHPTIGTGAEVPYGLFLETGELNRLRLAAESIGFQSSVSPPTLVRAAHAFTRGVVSAWPDSVRQHVMWIDSIFALILKYIVKQSLDIGICCQLQANIQDDNIFLLVSEMMDTDGAVCSPVRFLSDVDLMTVVETVGMASQSDFLSSTL